MTSFDLIPYGTSAAGTLTLPESYVRSLSDAGVTHAEGQFQISATPTLSVSARGLSIGSTKTMVAHFSLDLDPSLRKT